MKRTTANSPASQQYFTTLSPLSPLSPLSQQPVDGNVIPQLPTIEEYLYESNLGSMCYVFGEPSSTIDIKVLHILESYGNLYVEKKSKLFQDQTTFQLH
jgi:hypothetical protein